MQEKNSLVKKVALRIAPISAIVLLTLIVSLYLFNRLIKSETQECWDKLSASTESVADKMTLRLADDLKVLQLTADAIKIKSGSEDMNEVFTYLEDASETTMFTRIDIILPDGTQITPDGQRYVFDGDLPFDVLAERGPHFSPRLEDNITKTQVVYNLAPVLDEDGTTIALLMGVLDCQSIKDEFRTYNYENAQILIIDRADGNFIMNSWRESLGNAADLNERKFLEEFSDVDIELNFKNGVEGNLAFVSSDTGEDMYMHYEQIPETNWMVATIATEDVIFGDMYILRNYVYVTAVIEFVLILTYLLFNSISIYRSEKNKALADAAELERVTNDAKARFLSSISHDIRTPLNGIVGMLDIIDKYEETSDRTREALEKIRISTRYLITLSNDVLDINELESGKVVLINEPVNLERLADEISVLVAPKAKQAGIKYKMDASGLRFPNVLGSATHISRIMVNLITNAIKYNTKNGLVTARIYDRFNDEGRVEYVFTVADTGIGMSEEFQAEMFSAFTQEVSDARTVNKGHGLGLTIVYGLVKKMGGTVSVESEKDRGTEFTVVIPLEVDRDARGGSDPEEEVDLQDTVILLAEDNELNMEIAKTLLESLGATVIPARDGIEAVEKFSATVDFTVDVILMDIMMPRLDGYDATLKIRAMDRDDARHTPIFAMTASAFSEDIKKCHEVGMNEHFAKPLNMSHLAKKIYEYVHKN